MAMIPQAYMDAVVSIGVKNGEEINWIGTGFFVAKQIGQNKIQPFLVSNRHVFCHSPEVVIRMRQQKSKDILLFAITLTKNGVQKFSTHPNGNIDIAAVLLSGGTIEKYGLDFAYFDIDTNFLTSADYVKAGATAGSGIFMIGFPMGLVEVGSTAPICRAGCIARIDKAEIDKSQNVILDIHNFPGNSGSPIVSKLELVAITGTNSLFECELIGIVHSYIPYKESLINVQTQEVVEIRTENSGLALAHPSEFIRDVIDIELHKNYPNGIPNFEGEN